MATPSKYAVVERERRFLLAHLPDGVVESRRITDRYVVGSRLRLREVVHPDGTVERKLTHKVRLGDGPRAVACTNLYLDAGEWELLADLPSRTLTKTRHLVRREDVLVAVDELADGSLVAEIDGGATSPSSVPLWLEVLREVTDDEAWTGAGLARSLDGALDDEGPAGVG